MWVCVCCTFEAFRSVATAFADKLPRLLRRLFSKLRKHVAKKKTNTFFSQTTIETIANSVREIELPDVKIYRRSCCIAKL